MSAIETFESKRMLPRYCPACGFADMVPRAAKHCPECGKKWPSRSKEYDELATRKIKEKAQ